MPELEILIESDIVDRIKIILEGFLGKEDLIENIRVKIISALQDFSKIGASEIILNADPNLSSGSIIPRVINLELGSTEFTVSNLFFFRSNDPQELKISIEEAKKIVTKFLYRYIGSRVTKKRILADLKSCLGYDSDFIELEHEEDSIEAIRIQIDNDKFTVERQSRKRLKGK